jgi:DNA-binding transcriptional regulator YdaS (Cro superfamily)
MLKKDAVAHYGSQAAVARALGIQKAAVSKWGDQIPPFQASRLHQKTRGALKYDPTDYIGWYSRNRASQALPA